ncbi:precorrin-3B synthase [Pseudonocardia nematodicida]|uniref:Precorrin-3B synthase n=1 Tax=Pseudonocardia nematodicida TaxID=1206997 RepID=A0ABV1KDR7_9PSEU
MPTTARTRTDACPGVVSPHLAADGALARVRLPGGVITAGGLRAVAQLARDAGDGAAHLTSRGNLQLRGLDPGDPRPVRVLGGAGLLPSTTHERVRNVLASPWSGIAGGIADVRGLAADLDRGLCARPALAALPGRFLFALDDGRGDVAGERPDVCWAATSPTAGELLVAGTGTGLICAPADAPAVLLDAAAAFLDLRAEHAGDPETRAWRARELPDAARRVAHALGGPFPAVDRASRPRREQVSNVTAGSPTDLASQPRPRRGAKVTSGPSADPASRSRAQPGANVTAEPRPGGGPGASRAVGELGGGAVGAAPVLGELSATQLEVLAGLAPELIVTPWRTLVLPTPHDTAAVPDRLREAGLVVDPGHPALRVGACAGRPGCAKSLADVRAHARELIAAGPARPVYVAGCGRRCGAPHTGHVDAVATGPDSYLVDGIPARPAGIIDHSSVDHSSVDHGSVEPEHRTNQEGQR